MNSSPMDYSRKWYTMIAVGSGLFLSTVDSSIVNIALPTMVREFNVPFSTIQWVTLSYLLTLTSLMLSVGRLADMIGKKPIYTIGFIIYTLGALLSGLSPSVYLLIASRIFQASGAVMILALGMGIATEAFPPQERGKALGISAAIVSIGIVSGPSIGGFIIDALNWKWIFFVNVPVGIIGVCMAIFFIPSILPEGGQRFDFLGAGTLFISMVSLLFGLTFGQEMGFDNTFIHLLFLSCALFGLLFIYIQLRVAQPMIDLKMFRNPAFASGLMTGFLVFICLSGTSFLMPFYLDNVLGYELRQIGLLMAIMPLGMGTVAPISGSLSDRFGSNLITIIGLLLLAGGFFSLTTLSAEISTIGYILRFLPIGIGMGIFSSPNNSSIMGTAPKTRLGIVSGMIALMRTMGTTTGIATLGAIWASRVTHYGMANFTGDATEAPVLFQVSAYQDTFRFVSVVISLALCLAILRYFSQEKQNPSAEPASQINLP